MLHGSERDHKNLSVVDDNDDEEETIELHRGNAGNRDAPSGSQRSAHGPSSSPRRVASPRTGTSNSPRHELRLPTMPLRETFQSVLSATTQVVLKFSIGKRARKRVLWLALDGKLFLTPTKNDRNPSKFIFLADIYKVQKGSEAQSFTKSQSWREARGGGKEQLCLSIHGTSARREKTFALQVLTSNVRNIVAENLLALLQRMKSDADGEFPFVAQKVIAQQYAATGEVLALNQVEDILLREEDEKKNGGAILKEYSPDKKKKAAASLPTSRSSSRVLTRKGEVKITNDAAENDDNDEDDDEDDDDVLSRDDPRDILG